MKDAIVTKFVKLKRKGNFFNSFPDFKSQSSSPLILDSGQISEKVP